MTNADTNYYGFETTDEVKLDKAGLPVGVYKAMIVDEQPYEKEGQKLGIIAEYEVLDGTHKGRRGKQWLLTLHGSEQTANIARQNIKRIAEATGSPVSLTAPLKNRVLTIDVKEQKKNPEYTEIKRYLPESHTESPF